MASTGYFFPHAGANRHRGAEQVAQHGNRAGVSGVFTGGHRVSAAFPKITPVMPDENAA